MTGLLEIREKIKQIYAKCEIFVMPVVKFLLAYIVLTAVNNALGYMALVNNVALVLIVSLMCSFLSTDVLVFFAAVFSLAHMYALSIEVALVGLCIYLILYLLYFRFCPKDSLIVVLTPLLISWNIPYVVPMAVGLLCGPASLVSVVCGVVAYSVLNAVAGNASGIKAMGDDDAVGKIRIVVDGLVKNKAVLVLAAVFALTVLVVYLIRRLSVNYAWTIAMVAGAMVLIMALLVGDLFLDTNIPMGGTFFGTLLAILICKVIEFFRFCVDYNRIERVQFEDDEYYYYVKAVPKMMTSMPSKTAKHINSMQQMSEEGEQVMARTYRTPARRVVADRTAGTVGGNVQRTMGQRPASQRPVQGEYRTGRSVTVGTTGAVRENTAAKTGSEATDDYEELF